VRLNKNLFLGLLLLEHTVDVLDLIVKGTEKLLASLYFDVFLLQESLFLL